MLASQQFCVKWNSYSSNLQNVFPRLLNSEHFVDITLACEGQMIKCHKVVLSACSTYFERLLVHNPCQHPIIFMKDLKHWEVQALVDFMYKGEVNVSQDELNSLLAAAEALQIRGLCGSEHANRNQPDGNRQSNVSSGVTKIPSVSLPHDTVLSGSSSVGQDSQQLKRRRPPSVEKDQFQSSLPKISNVTSTSPSPRGSSLSETNNITSPLLPVTDQIKTDIGADVLEEVPEKSNEKSAKIKRTYSVQRKKSKERNIVWDSTQASHDNKKTIKQEVDMDDTYPETELDADGPDDDYGNLEHQDDSDGNNRDEAARQSALDQPGPSGMIPTIGQPVDKAATDEIQEELLRLIREGWLPEPMRTRMRRSYSSSSLWQALLDVKEGGSIYMAAKHNGVPRKTLRNWMKRWNIKNRRITPSESQGSFLSTHYNATTKSDLNAALALQNVMCVLSPTTGKIPVPSTPNTSEPKEFVPSSTPGSGGATRIRRSEAELKKAAECVQKGMTFQNVSDIFNIPISTIRFYMARRGILPQRRRGRISNSSQNPATSHSQQPPYMMLHYKLPDINKKVA